MAFPFSNWFKSKPGAPGDADAQDKTASSPPPPVSQPPAPSMVRTVTPNSVQPVRLHEAQPAVARAPITLPTGSPNAGGQRKISFPGAPDQATEETAFPVSRYQPEPPPANVAPEMTVSLELGDFLDRLPANFLQPGPFDRSQRVDFLASELYSDLSRGRATVPASVIYQKCPQVFSRPITETEDVEIYLPLNKLVEQLGTALQPRVDQIAEESVVEIETPFLQVALEDNVRLPKAPGTSMGATIRPMNAPPLPGNSPKNFPVPAPAMLPSAAASAPPPPRAPNRTGQILPISPIKPPADLPAPPLAPPTAQSTGPIMTGKRPPSTVRASVAGGKIRLSGPAVSSRSFSPGANPPVPAPTPSGVDAPHADGPAAPRPNPLMPADLPPPTSPSHQVTKKTARIQIPPISLRPAGAGPRPPVAPAPSIQPSPVPIRPGSEPLPNFREAPPAAPVRNVAAPMTFRSTPPPSAKPVPPSFAPLKPVFPPPAFPAAPPPPPSPGLTASSSQSSVDSDVENSSAGAQRIEMSLAAILRAMPAPALEISPSAVPEDVRISLPFHRIESQLGNGRVAVPIDVFVQALPEAYSHALAADSGLMEVSIPLQEVFQNLPANALSRRADQIIEEVGNHYPTPFSQKAEEDAQRFAAASQPTPPVEPPAPAAEAPAPMVAFQREALELPTLPPETAEAIPVSLPSLFAEHPAVEATEPFVDKASEEATHSEASPALPTETDQPTEELEPAAEQAPAELPPEEPAPITNEPDLDAPTDLHPEAQTFRPFAAIELPPIPESASAETELRSESAAPEVAASPEPAFGGEDTPHQAELPAIEPAPEPAPAEALAPELAAPAEYLSALEQAAAESAPFDLTQPDEELASASEQPTPETEPERTDIVSASSSEEALETQAETEILPEPTLIKTPELRDITEPAVASVDNDDATELQTLFMTEDELDAKSIVRLVNQLPGIQSCTVMFSDGLLLAGGLPGDADTEGFSAMAPSFYQRARNFAGETALGALQAFTLYTDQGLISFFMHNDICLSVQHKGRGFLPGVREKLSVVTRELAKMYRTDQPVPTLQPHHG